jgi:hypothetical protein
MRVGAAAVAVLFLAIYLPDIGHGFISDDFRWIVESRVESPADILALFSANVGFYRPVTSLAFAVDHALWGDNALGYGVTNLLSCLAAAAMLFAVARRLALPNVAALVAAAAWLLNFHGVNMAVLWLSGRTSILATLFSLSTAWAALGGRALLAGALALCAMLAKEEAVALPLLFSVFFVVDERRPRAAVKAVPIWIALIVYVALRLQSGAFWPGDAPSYYQFAFEPTLIARNVLEYADRAGTIFVAIAAALALATRTRWASLAPPERRVLTFAALWIAAMYGLTVFLPVRSSLYALLPSAGTALALGAIASSAWKHDSRRARIAAVVMLIAAIVLVPVYWLRNERWVGLAELSERSIRSVAVDAAGKSPGHVVLIDAPQERSNLTSAFGNLLPEAMVLRVGAGWSGEIVLPGAEPQRAADRSYRLENGSLAPIPAAR